MATEAGSSTARTADDRTAVAGHYDGDVFVRVLVASFVVLGAARAVVHAGWI